MGQYPRSTADLVNKNTDIKAFGVVSIPMNNDDDEDDDGARPCGDWVQAVSS